MSAFCLGLRTAALVDLIVYDNQCLMLMITPTTHDCGPLASPTKLTFIGIKVHSTKSTKPHFDYSTTVEIMMLLFTVRNEPRSFIDG